MTYDEKIKRERQYKKEFVEKNKARYDGIANGIRNKNKNRPLSELDSWWLFKFKTAHAKEQIKLDQARFKKLEKAVEIVATKGIDIKELINHRSFSSYNNSTKYHYVKDYTEEEFNLLQEIFVKPYNYKKEEDFIRG